MASLKTDKKGQSAVADAVIFLIIMLVASGIITSYSLNEAAQISAQSDDGRLVEMLYTSVMKSTLYNCVYIDPKGGKIDFSNRTVEEVLIEDLSIRKSGSANMSSIYDIERCVKRIIDAMISEGNYYYLECVSGTVKVVIYNGIPSEEKIAFSQSVRLPGGEDAEFTMYVW